MANFSSAFEEGDLVRFRRLDTDRLDPRASLVPLWPSPLDLSNEGCSWVPGGSLAVILESVGTSYRIFVSNGSVGWADTWDLEKV